MNAILNEQQIKKAIATLAECVCRDVSDLNELVIVGVHTGGVHLAQRLQNEIADRRGTRAPCGSLDITLYRDDLFEGLTKPIVGATILPESIEGREVLLVDDVLYTGRTVRAALLELMDYGRPKRIRLAVLIDRGHRELPILADYVGCQLDTSKGDNIHVNLRETTASADEVVLLRSVS
jgi:pyrimidine operon attenuation protein/uracil phosphoribosyltransferase